MKSLILSWMNICFCIMIVNTVDPFFERRANSAYMDTRIEITSICLNDTTYPLNDQAVHRHLIFRHTQAGYYKLISFDVCFNVKKLSSVISQLLLDKRFDHRFYKQHKRKFSCNFRRLQNIFRVISYMPHFMTMILDQALALDQIEHIAFFSDIDGGNFLPYNKMIVSGNIILNYSKNFILDIFRRYRFNHVTLIYLKNNTNDWPSNQLRESIWNELVSSHDVCVEMNDLNASDPKSISTYVESLQKDGKDRLVILWSSERIRNSVLHLVDRLSDHVLWFTERSPFGFYFRQFFFCVIHNCKPYCADIQFSNTKLPYAWVVVDQFKTFAIINLKTGRLKGKSNSEWSLNGDYEKWLSCNIALVSYYWKIIYTVRNRDYLYKEIKFRYKRFHIDQIFNITNTTNKKLRCKPSCPPGEEPVSVVSSNTSSVKALNWICKRCGMNKVKSFHGWKNCIPCTGLTIPNEHQTSCISSCVGFTVPDKDQKYCIDPYKDMYLSHSDVKSDTLIFANASFIIFNIGIFFVFIYHRKTPIIIASGSTSNIVQLSAHLLVFLQLYPLFFGKLNVFKCTFQVVTNGTLFTLILSLLFTKIQKTLVAFKSKVRLSRREVIISQAVEVFITVLLLSVDIFILLISYYESTPTVETKIDSKTFLRTVICKNEKFFRLQYVYILALSILCSMQAFRSRNLPKYFSETTEVCRSVIFTVIAVLVRFAILASGAVEDKNFANAIFIILINFAQMALRYSKICNTVVFHPEKNTKEYVSSCLFQNTRQQTDESMEMRQIRSKTD